MVAAGEPEEVAADKARGARKDKMAKRRADAMRGRSAADAEAERKNEGERADAQARCDAVATHFGETAPPPMSGELALDYRKRLLRRPISAAFADVQRFKPPRHRGRRHVRRG